jgi:hypothetical protein
MWRQLPKLQRYVHSDVCRKRLGSLPLEESSQHPNMLRGRSSTYVDLVLQHPNKFMASDTECFDTVWRPHLCSEFALELLGYQRANASEYSWSGMLLASDGDAHAHLTAKMRMKSARGPSSMLRCECVYSSLLWPQRHSDSRHRIRVTAYRDKRGRSAQWRYQFVAGAARRHFRGDSFAVRLRSCQRVQASPLNCAALARCAIMHQSLRHNRLVK